MLGTDTFYLRSNALALFRQTGIVTANLVACSLTLSFQHLDLVVDVVELLAGNSSVIYQFRETLSLALCVGNLLVDGRELFLEVELTTVGSAP